MNNLFPNIDLKNVFDLKGSKKGRLAKKNESILKDLG